MWTASWRSSSANWCVLVKLSPVAIGTGERRATATIDSMPWWGTGSSNQAGRNSDESIGDPQRRTHAEPAVALDHEVHGRSHGLADGGHDLDREIFLVAVLDPPRRPERIELHGRVAAGRHSLRGLRDRLRRPSDPIPAVRIDADAVAHPPAKERVDRLAGGLAEDVPAGDLDRRHGAHVDLAAVRVGVADHPLEERLDIGRVGPDVLVAQLLDRGLDGGREPVERPFTCPVDALVRVDPDEEPVLPGIAHEERLDVRDLHRVASAGLGDRAAATAATSSAARASTSAGSPLPVSQLPMPTATAPAAMKAGAVSAVTPPVGTSGISRSGPRTSRTNAGPTADAGKSFTAAAPARHAARISVGVNAPGSAGMPRAAAQPTIDGRGAA